ncbi:Retrovirus-related Pol polyprotein, partial [Mucuna pruriens]
MSIHLVPNPKPTNDTSSSPPPPTKLKPLSSHLKYAYLDTEQQLLHKKAIGWKLSNLLGINPSICMHRILVEEEAWTIRQQQRRLNSTILDVVKKKVTKLLATEIIYPISDSQWVSPMQVVPKKSWMTVMKNQHDELNNWLVCIDYRKVNQTTRKDHFPLPFIDQVLEKLVKKIPLLLSRWTLWIHANPHCTGRPTQYDLHLPIRHLCIHMHVVWPV